MQTISELFSQDVPMDAISVLCYPTSHSKLLEDKRFLRNRTKYLVDDEFRLPSYESYHIELALRAMCVFGDRIRVHSDVIPSESLLEHWSRKLGKRDVLRYGNLGECVPHVVFFPMEDLPEELHAVDPDVHYRLHSKAFIPTVDCPQPAVYHSLRLPAVLKACRAASSEGTWMIHTVEEYNERKIWLSEHMPHADVIMTEMVEKVVSEYTCQVYINRKGHVTWIGAAGKDFDQEGFWCGGSVNMLKQDMPHQDDIRRRYQPTLEPLMKGLHENKYFGYCGIDVLEDSGGRHYIIDVNTFLCGTLTFVLVGKVMEGHGWPVGIFKTSLVFDKTIPEVLQSAEEISGGEAVVLSAYAKDKKTVCQMVFFSDTRRNCFRLANEVNAQKY